jgi:cytochrome c-type biogenesis protein CcmH/NrfF
MALSQLLIAIPMTVLGCVLLAAGIVLIWRSLLRTATATVDALDQEDQHAVLRFTTRDGQPVMLRVPAAAGRYQPGEQVTVLYDADYPQIAQVASPLRLWVLPAVLALAGLGVGLAGFSALAAAVR